MCVCVCVCVVIPFILDVRLVYAPAGVTKEEGHTGFLHLPSAVLALVFIARRIQSFLSLVVVEVEFCNLVFCRVRVLSVGYLNCYKTHRNSL